MDWLQKLLFRAVLGADRFARGGARRLLKEPVKRERPVPGAW